MNKETFAPSIPFFPIGLKPSKATLIEIEHQLRPESLNQLISKQNFLYHYPVGRGGFGRVWKVEHKRNKCNYALKEMQKMRVVSKRSVHSVMNELKLLATLKHSFIVNIHYAFQDRENLYLVLDYMKGGDLRYHLSRLRTFSEEQTKFFAACIILALEYLHSKNVIHRDIKPENLVMDDNGYLSITDFGVARVCSAENAKDTSGTPGYMAPEVLCRQNHTFSVDYFALGVIVYEIMMGRRPYVGRDRKEIRDQILSKQAVVRLQDKPKGWSLQAADFVNQLLIRKPANRLGKDPFEVRNHPWFKDFPWKELFEKSLDAPFVPLCEDNFDPRVAGDWKDEIDSNLQMDLIQSMFPDYHFEVTQINPESPDFVHKKNKSRRMRIK